ncbi:septal ring lytic transglycosylase RlpA family protein [Rhizobium soli]
MRLSGGIVSLSAKWLGMTVVFAAMASCATTKPTPEPAQKQVRSKEYFSEKEYGVKASPRVVKDGQPVPKGGGRFMVGQPYQVRGKTYVPKEDPQYNKSGLASWYGSAFHGRYTANGEVYDSASLTAAHPTFPLPSYARVTNVENGSSVIVRVNDRGPYHAGRILDVSSKTAELLDMKRSGTAKVNVQYVGRARMDGEDTPFLMASYIRKGDRLPSFNPGGGQSSSGVMVASNQPLRDQMQSFGSSVPTPAAYPSRAQSNASSKRGFQQAEQYAASPRPVERSTAGTVRAQAPQRQVAAVAPKPAPVQAPTQKAIAAPAEQQVASQQRYVQPVAPARAEQQIRPVANRAQQAWTSETAYVEPPKGHKQQVMFGNVLLQD